MARHSEWPALYANRLGDACRAVHSRMEDSSVDSEVSAAEGKGQILDLVPRRRVAAHRCGSLWKSPVAWMGVYAFSHLRVDHDLASPVSLHRALGKAGRQLCAEFSPRTRKHHLERTARVAG